MSFLLHFPRVVSLVFPRFSLRNMERIIANNKLVVQGLDEVKKEFEALRVLLTEKYRAELEAENAALEREIAAQQKRLMELEVAAGRRQIPVPGQKEIVLTSSQAPTPPKAEAPAPQVAEKKKEQPAKKAKPEKIQKGAAEKAPAAEEAPIDIRRLDLRVGKIVECSRHPEADALYLEKIDCGEAAPRTVISGLVKFVPIEEMQNRMVIVLCNLKPAKMRGITSEAMVMCASTPEKVEVLSPPVDAVPGDLVHCDGFPREPDAQMNPKKKIFETVAPDLRTNGSLEACYKEAKLVVPGKGPILAQTLKNVNVK